MRHFLDLSDWKPEEILHLLDEAKRLKAELKNGGNEPVLAGKTLAMVFQKPSLRTRTSFDIGMYQLGGYAVMIGPTEVGLGQRESVGDVARVLSGYAQGIMARVFDHQHVVEMARYASVPVINGLSDDRHPCQALADMLTIYETFDKIEGLKIAYVGDGNNVAASLLMASVQLGARFAIATPKGMELPRTVLDNAIEQAATHPYPINVEVFHNAQEAVEGADVVYTDTWVSMGQEGDRDEKIKHFDNFQVNRDLMARANDDAIVMHCLPAHRGEEITDEVADGEQSAIFRQAENRLHAQKALLIELMS